MSDYNSFKFFCSDSHLMQTIISQKSELKVFERGLKAIPLSVDLWIHYLTYVKQKYQDDCNSIRSQFERALNACGLEFRSDKVSRINTIKKSKCLSNQLKLALGRLHTVGIGRKGSP